MPSGTFQLRLDCAELDDSRLQALARDVARGIRDERLGNADLAQTASVPGAKGDPVTIGEIGLTLIQTGGVVVTLLQVLKSFIERKQTLRFELTRADGKKVALDASGFGKSTLASTQKLVADFMKD